jgi:hypothetical protein
LPLRRIRTRRLELGAALAAALLVGGCGGGGDRAAPPPTRLPSAVAARLAADSDQVAARLAEDDGCGALAAARRLRSEAIAAVNAGRVPARFQESLTGAANDLTLRIHCAPRAAPATPAEQNDDQPARHDKGHDHGHGHGHKHGHGDRKDEQ